MKKKKTPKKVKKPQPRFSYTTLGVLCIIGATLCFAFQGIIIKTLFTLDVSVTEMLLWRQVIFLPFYITFLAISYPKGLKPMGWHDTLSIMAVGSLGFFLIPLTNSSALHHIEAGIERILLYTYPLFVVLITALYTKRLPARQHIIAFFVIQAGIFLLIGGADSLEKLYIGLLPALQVLFAAVMFAVYTLLIKKWVEKYGSHRFFTYGVFGSLILILINYAIQEPFHLPSPEGWFFLSLMTLVSFPPSILFAEGVKRVGSTRAAFISTLGPVATVIFADIILGERLSFSQVIGGAVVMAMISALEAPALRNFIRVLRTRKK